MNYFESAILGVIQGLTEFLPVSSSGHLVIFQNLLGLKEPELLFDIMLHGATLLATLIVFRKEVVRVFQSVRAVLLIIVGSIPAGIIGFFFLDVIEQSFGSLTVAGYGLLITSVVLWFTRFNRPKAIDMDGFLFNDMTFFGAFLIGIAQSFALVPGISRSGMTIAMALFLKTRRRDAATFSFILSMPAIAGALFLKLIDSPQLTHGLPVIGLGFFLAFIVGIFALMLLIRIVEKGSFYTFSYYCLFVGLGALFLART